jgi:hypothetical protein
MVHKSGSPPLGGMEGVGDLHCSPACSLTNGGNDCQQRARLRYLVPRVHRFGEAPLYHLFADLAGGADLWDTLEECAALAPLADFIAANGGDRFQSPFAIKGGLP